MESLFAKSDQYIALTPMEIVRQAIDEIDWTSRLIAIQGAKGVGKSTLIRQYIKRNYPNHSTEYGKTKGDFKVDGVYTFEIGGPDKGFSQIAGVDRSYVFADGIEMPSGRKLPLWMLGFLY